MSLSLHLRLLIRRTVRLADHQTWFICVPHDGSSLAYSDKKLEIKNRSPACASDTQ